MITNRSIAFGSLLAANFFALSSCIAQVSWVEGEEKRVQDLANTSADSHLPAAQDELLKVSTFVSQLEKAHNEKKHVGAKTLLVSVTACPQKRQCLKMDIVLFILRLSSAEDELMNGALCTLLAGSRLHLLLTKPEALNDGRKCLEEGESNQTNWKLLLCG